MEPERWIRDSARRDLDDPASGSVRWSIHAIQELVRDGLARKDVQAAIASCEVIERYPVGRRVLPDFLVVAFLADGRPVHAVVAVDEPRRRLLVITVYRPDPARWCDDWKTRRRR